MVDFITLVQNVHANNGKLPNFVYNGKVRVAVKVDKVIDGGKSFIGKQEDGSYRHFKLSKIS